MWLRKASFSACDRKQPKCLWLGLWSQKRGRDLSSGRSQQGVLFALTEGREVGRKDLSFDYR